ncbi:MAG: hypothetical protein JW976_00285 [Syntrophaceae bacterium]|nr:hypothetical protein [Syntrophaceae bacterium]
MDTITISRFLPLVAIIIVFLVIKLTSPPREVFRVAFTFSWVAGFLNLLVDIVEQHYRFWHYTEKYLIFGFPIDLYISVSLVVGIALPLVYWWLKSFHEKMVIPFLIILPFFFLLQDYVLIKATGYSIVVFDSPYWWLADFPSLCVILYGTLFVFNVSLRRKKNLLKT